MSEEKDSRLAKLYSLQESGEWNSICTGIVIISNNESQNQHVINLHDPEHFDTILYTIRIDKSIAYQKNDRINVNNSCSVDCLIQWKEDGDTELALSFLTETHRDTIMKQLEELCDNCDEIDCLSQVAVDSEASFLKPNDLPEVSPSTFSDICSKFAEMAILSIQPLINKLLENNAQYLRSLLEYADDFIGFDDLDPVHDLACGLSKLISVGRRDFIDVIFSDEFYLGLFNVSDYHTLLYKEQHNNLRETFEKKVKFHKVLEFENEEIIRLIHTTFRLQYYRDSICLNIMYSPFGDSLLTIINENINQITDEISNNPNYPSYLMRMLNPEEDLEEPIGLLYHLFPNQVFALNHRVVMSLFKSFFGVDMQNEDTSDEVLEMEEKAKTDPDTLNLFDKLDCVLNANKQSNSTIQKLILLIEKICRLNVSYCCSYFFSKKNETGNHLFKNIINLLLYSSDYGVQMSVFSIMGILIGRDSLITMDDQLFLRVFYSEFIHLLVDPVLDESLTIDSQLLILDLLSAFISYHASHIHGYLADGHVLAKLAKKLQSDSSLNQCAVLQVFSAGISLSDGWFGKILVEKGVLEEIFKITNLESLQGNNLFSSKLLHFYNMALVKENYYVLSTVADSIEKLGVGELPLFVSIREWVEEKQKQEQVSFESVRDERIKEQMDEEAYFDGEDEENEEVIKIEEEKVEDVIVDKEEEQESDPGDSLLSFFGTSKPVHSGSSLKMNLNLNLHSIESETKRQKLE